MKRFASLIFLFGACFTLQAQSFSLAFKSSESLLIERSIQKGLIVMSQEYQLEDTLTHKRYSLDNQEYFGKSHSFAVLVENGIITSPRIVRPWESDENFIRYKNSKYQPVVSKTSAMAVNDTTWKETLLLDPQGIFPLKDSTWCFLQDSTYNQGFVCDTLRKEDEGWLVWMIAEGINDKEFFSLETVRYKHTEESNDKVIQALSGNVIGGIFISPSYERIGQLVLKLEGILTPFEEGWKLSSIVVDNKSMLDETENVSAPVLTPIEKEEESKPDEGATSENKETKKRRR